MEHYPAIAGERRANVPCSRLKARVRAPPKSLTVPQHDQPQNGIRWR
jgi:hypothetical protein